MRENRNNRIDVIWLVEAADGNLRTKTKLPRQGLWLEKVASIEKNLKIKGIGERFSLYTVIEPIEKIDDGKKKLNLQEKKKLISTTLLFQPKNHTERFFFFLIKRRDAPELH